VGGGGIHRACRILPHHPIANRIREEYTSVRSPTSKSSFPSDLARRQRADQATTLVRAVEVTHDRPPREIDPLPPTPLVIHVRAVVIVARLDRMEVVALEHPLHGDDIAVPERDLGNDTAA